jgi:deoxyribonuclease-4
MPDRGALTRYAGRVRIGIHSNTGGSLERAAVNAHQVGANTMQIFSASPRMWRAKPPDKLQVQILNAARLKHDINPLVIHSNYLINLASPPSATRENSIQAFRGEIERAIIIGADYLVVHPGNYKGLALEQGMLNVAEAIALAWRAVDDAQKVNPRLTILLENTAGTTTQLGGDLSELAIIQQLASKFVDLPIGFCLDTCHCHVYGFDLATVAGFEKLLITARETIGLENVPVIHSNDAKAVCGSHTDRHANIGTGYIGLEGFRRILNHPDLRAKAFILETPDEEAGGGHLRDIATLKELVSPKKSSTPKKSSPVGTNAGPKTRRSM